MSHSEAQELRNFAEAWDKAMESNDADAIGEFMSEDWVVVGADGITSKASFLEWISSGTVAHNRMDSDQLHVKIHGSTGIVLSRGTSAGTYNGKSFSLYEWSTNVFTKNDGKWLCVVTMLAPANRDK